MADTLPFTIQHYADSLEDRRRIVTGYVRVTLDGIEIGFNGYTEACSTDGPPIFIEVDNDGHPVVRIWADVLQEDPTHKVNLAGAHCSLQPRDAEDPSE